MAAKSLMVIVALLSVPNLVSSARVAPSRYFQFSPAAFQVSSLPFNRWPRMDEFFQMEADEEPMPYEPSRYYGVAEPVESRGAPEPDESTSEYSRGYFDDSFMPKSIVLTDDGSIEARFPFPSFNRPSFPFNGAFGAGAGPQRQN